MYNPTAYDQTIDIVSTCFKNLGFIFPIFYFIVEIIHSKYKYLKNPLFSTFKKSSEHSVFSVLLLDSNRQNMVK